VRKFGVNVNQAVRQLNVIGEAPSWLDDAVKVATHAVAEVEVAATAMAVATRRQTAVRPSRVTGSVAGTAAPSSGDGSHPERCPAVWPRYGADK
jgi:hypothetical protein